MTNINSEVNHYSFFSYNKVDYILNHLLKVSFGSLPSYRFNFDSIKGYVLVEVFYKESIINLKFYISNDHVIQSFLKREEKLNLIDSYDEKQSIPVIKVNSKEIFFSDNCLDIHYDFIGVGFIVLSRYEESISSARDSLGRFMYDSSLAKFYNFIDIPIVDEYAMILRKYLVSYFNILPHCRKTCIIPTHDIDFIIRFQNLYKSIRTILADLIKYKNLNIFFCSIKDFIISIFNFQFDPYYSSIKQILSDSKKLELKSEFYFMSSKRTDFDSGYVFSKYKLDEFFSLIHKNDMIIGFHPGFYTYNNNVEYNCQLNKLKSLVNQEILFNRQHFLRLDVNFTFDIIEAAGIKYDSSMGFAEREGFRCGTCHPFNPYNFKADKNYSFFERPLIVMDVTLLEYRKFRSSRALQILKFLYNQCLRVEGDFIFLWHNSTVYRSKKLYKKFYRFLGHKNNVLNSL